MVSNDTTNLLGDDGWWKRLKCGVRCVGIT